ncbi:MAG: HAMP domain-containing sensor histidine kinase [Oscillospiraceae bacterium]
MMKFKKPRVSIKTKIWFAIIGTVVAVIATIWILQTFYLEGYYLKKKQTEFSSVVNSVVKSITDKGVIGSQEELYTLASKYILCIDIADSKGRTVVTYEGLNYNCYIHQNEKNRLDFLNFALQNGENQIITHIDEGKNSEYFIGSTVGKTTVGELNDYFVTVSIALAPIQEATIAMREQLMYILIILMLLATAIAFWLARSLTKNILKINIAARQVANGNLDVDVNVKSNDELGDLSESFSNMTREIAKVNVLQKEIVANISHDIRTPLTMIKGYAEAIKDITGDDKVVREQQLDIIVDEANRLNTLVNDVMDLSLMQAGQSALNLASFDITTKVSDILSRFQLLEHTEGLEFQMNAGESFNVLADEVRIEQVLYNIINNAVNHIGEIKQITVSITRDGDDEVKLQISDTGTGISEADLPLIWDRYYKPYKNTERKGMGTGLGLSIVKAILIKHNSRFGVTSTLGVGSNFWFTLKNASPQDEEK